jgi:hypothetical protein
MRQKSLKAVPHTVKFQVLTAANMKMTVLWDIASYSFAEIDRRFRSVLCVVRATSFVSVCLETHRSDGGNSKYL